MAMKKQSRGRQKIEIKRIQNEDARQVCFSKRRSGLFKKASELCILCGAEIAIIIFSQAGKAFSFGHPSIESVIDRFITRDQPSTALVYGDNLAYGGSSLRDLSRQYTDLAFQVEEEKRKKGKLDCVVRNGQDLFWWESPIENMRLDELEQFGASMEELRKKVRKRADEMLVEASSSTAFLAMNSVGVVDPFMVEAPTVITRSFGFGRGLF